MLVIDDKMFKLAKMQETLLKLSTTNKEENLNNYKKTVAEIDEKAFNDILEETKLINEHNQSLEEELQFLERIVSAYNQLLELQLSFKRVCEVYGNNDLKLSDLSRLNIEYIENRVNAINGYLVNLSNIESNKGKLQKLSEQLVAEERKKGLLDDRLKNLEEVLRYNFVNAEGRCIVDGNLQYTSVSSEYEKIGLDLDILLNDNVSLNNSLSKYEKEMADVSEKLKTAEICYNSILSSENRLILNEINTEYLKIKYKVVMLKMALLMVKNVVSYDLFIKKREDILDLIKIRLSCMEQLGFKYSIDPFSRIKVKEQLDAVLSMSNNSNIINQIRKDINELNLRTEEMISQNTEYLITLNDTKNLIESNIGINDIDITSVELPFFEPVVNREIVENQVVDVRNVSESFNMNKVSQKTSSVIKRVNLMMNKSLRNEEDVKKVLIPELVVVPSTLEKTKSDGVPQIVVSDEVVSKIDNEEYDEFEEDIDDELDLPIEEEIVKPVVNYTDIFETLTPFDEPVLFVEKADNDLSEVSDGLTDGELNNISNKKTDNLELQMSESEEVIMPEAFWVTQEGREEKVEDENSALSFDEQINALLSSENNDISKVRKRAA